MKSGRMKGQAFITFPDESIAQKALKQTNGYLLREKPIVVVIILISQTIINLKTNLSQVVIHFFFKLK